LNCKEERSRKEKTIVVNLLTGNLTFFLDVLSNMYSDEYKKCDNCDDYTMKSKYTFGRKIFIELFAPPSDGQQLKNFDVSLTLSSIPHCLDGNKFTLRGVINFIPPLSIKKDAIGHYVSYCWREHTNTWERYDDLQCASRTARPTTLVANCQFIIYTC